MRKKEKRVVEEKVVGKQDRMGRLFVAPPVILFLLFTLLPMIMAIGLSFTKYDVINPPRLVGLANFRKMIKDEFFWIALKNTCVYTLMYVPAGLLLSLGSEVCRIIPDLVLSAGAFVNSCYGNAVVLDPESSAGSAEWDSGIVRDQRKGLAV